ncbi:uncharacterized protein LOC129959814 [Argiope bruennichi]|uniref:uncharacterized protein LOC129959814 n=1 Tax=Argiope bruennichi TaxID=94029 RepID=UPI002494DF52|nr:uncharacterized protein LOC129959814 [Argiope bruennichi]
MTTAYHPQTNGLTERFNKTLAYMLSMYVDVEQKNWDQILSFVTFAYSTTKHDTTGFTPFYLIHGRELETPLDTMLPLCSKEFSQEDDYVSHLINKAEESRQLARARTLEAQQKDRRRYDSKHRIVAYEPGDWVGNFIPVRKIGLFEKLLKRYTGPYQILRWLFDVTYEVADFDPNSRRRKSKEVVHILRMKPYHDPEEQDDQHSYESMEVPERDISQRVTPREDATTYTGLVTRSRTRATKLNVITSRRCSSKEGEMPH